MARPRLQTRDAILQRAVPLFWRKGYAQLGMDELVAAIGSSRSLLYGEFGSKRGLFIAALEAYADGFVTRAIEGLRRGTGGLDDIEAYFHALIDEADRMGLPGPGCLMANTMTELAAHDEDVRAIVEAHLTRLQSLFADALRRTGFDDAGAPGRDARSLAMTLVLMAQGLWAYSRMSRSREDLDARCNAMMCLLRKAASA